MVTSMASARAVWRRAIRAVCLRGDASPRVLEWYDETLAVPARKPSTPEQRARWAANKRDQRTREEVRAKDAARKRQRREEMTVEERRAEWREYQRAARARKRARVSA